MFTRRIDNLTGLASMAREVESLMNELFAEPKFAFAATPAATRFPALNIFETRDALVVEAELPGFTMKDLEVTLENGELTIAGRREIAELPEGAAYQRRERSVGQFSRTVRIEETIDAEKVAAKLADGVLTITLPKAAAMRPRRIEVSTN
ncbi:MAG: Hsp20/alpha crystallin family protein [Phycisphaerales bacterium]|nr:Hsp20/alpha crystallin family protein [Phycisphaerales bacterium]